MAILTMFYGIIISMYYLDAPYVGIGVFAPLSDESFFRRVKVFLGSIQWPNGADLCPDTLYLDSISI